MKAGKSKQSIVEVVIEFALMLIGLVLILQSNLDQSTKTLLLLALAANAIYSLIKLIRIIIINKQQQ